MGNYYLTNPDMNHVEVRALESAARTGEDQVLHVHKFKDGCEGYVHVTYRPDGSVESRDGLDQPGIDRHAYDKTILAELRKNLLGGPE